MKSFTNQFLVGLFMVGVSACSNENGQVPDGTLPGTDNVYMALNLSFPQSRSQTDGTGSSNSNADPDIEVGTQEENKVEKMKIYLIDSATEQPLGTGYAVPASDKSTLVGGNGSYVAKFDGQDLKGHAGKKAKVYVVCNYDASVNFEKDEIFNIPDFPNNADGNTRAFWKPDLFIMSNAEQSDEIDLPTDVDMTYKYSNPTTPFKLGVVKVERTAARFDYKAKDKGNLYTFNEEVNVQLTDMGVLNVSKEEYVFRHVGKENGHVDGICITETADNYVITPYWNQKTKSFYNDRNVQFNNKNSINYINLSTGKLRDNDNWNGTGGDYKPMAYSSEVTSTKRPLNKDVTAIVFRGKLVAGDNCPENIRQILTDKDEKLYAYGDKIYGAWDDVKKEAEKADANDVLLVAAYNKAVALANNNTTITDKFAAQAGFTVYTKNDKTDAYDVYYYYVNRHNDTGDGQVAELDKPMRYGVVRNNVYKLHVKNIKKYGHPFNPDGDPDPYDPEEKVDPENIYFEVGVKVLPWTVRVNDIEF